MWELVSESGVNMEMCVCVLVLVIVFENSWMQV